MLSAMMRRLAFAVALAAALAGCKKEPSPSPSPPPAPPPAPAPPAPSADAGAADAAKALAAIIASCANTAGEVQVRRAGQEGWEPVATGSVFRAGDVVKTGPGGFARVEFIAGGGLEVEQNANVVIDTAPAKPAAAGSAATKAESRVSVESGVVRGFLPAAPAGAEPLGIVVKTGEGQETRLAAEAGEKPVAFRLTRGKVGTEVAVVKGELRLSSNQGAEKTVEKKMRKGQVVEVAQAGVGDVADLLDFPASVDPGIDARFRWSKGLAIRMSWRAVPRATGYRVQIARDLAFQGIESSEDVAGTESSFSPREEGVYTWRVASRDPDGRYGEYGFARRIFCEKEAPKDLLVGPTDGATVKFSDQPPPIAFTWQSAGDAQSYRLVIAKGRDLNAEPFLSRTTPEQRLEVENLAPGEYVWGVYVDDRRTPEPIFVKPRLLLLQKVARAKVKVPKALSDWGPAERAQ